MSSRSREKRLKVLGNVGLAALAVVTAGVVASVALSGSAAPPVSQQVQSYYDLNASATPTPTPTKAEPLAVQRAGEPLDVLFAGDSITVGRDASTKETSFRSLVTDALEAEGTRIGNSSRTTAEVAPDVAAAPAAQDVVVVELGTNDVYKSTPAQFAADYPALLDSIRTGSPGAALLCAGVWQSNPTQRLMDDTIQTECEKRGGRFASLAAIYADKANQSTPGQPHWDGGLTDGNHPNDAGHKKIADALLSLVTVS